MVFSIIIQYLSDGSAALGCRSKFRFKSSFVSNRVSFQIKCRSYQVPCISSAVHDVFRKHFLFPLPSADRQICAFCGASIVIL